MYIGMCGKYGVGFSIQIINIGMVFLAKKKYIYIRDFHAQNYRFGC